MSDVNSRPGNIDLNQGCDSNTRENPEEIHVYSSSEENNTPLNLPRANVRSNGGWFPGESSSNVNSRSRLFGRELNLGNDWSSSTSAVNRVADTTSAVNWVADTTSAVNWVADTSTITRPYISIYDIFDDRPMNSSSTFVPVNANVSHNNDVNPNRGSINIFQPSGSRAQQPLPNDDGLVSSPILGLSCKRKADEGCSDPSFPRDEAMYRRSFPAHFNGSGSNGLINERNPVGINLGPLPGQQGLSIPVLDPELYWATPTPLNHPYLVQNSSTGRNTIPYNSRGPFFSQGSSSSDPIAFSNQVESVARTVPPPFPHLDPSNNLWSVPPPVWTTTHQTPGFPTQSPWIQFPPVGPIPGGQNGHFTVFPLNSPPIERVVQSGPATNVEQNRESQTQSLLREIANGEMNGSYDINARRDRRDRLLSEIHHALNAIGRSENIGPEDYMIEDPYFSEPEDLHDNHIDMRLDVDNMSYEELLALEEHIGDVNTGLSEETVMKLLKQKKYKLVKRESSSNQEPCCVCQEEYIVGDDIGELDCGHRFHTICIKQWVMLKNICPICKLTGLVPKSSS